MPQTYPLILLQQDLSQVIHDRVDAGSFSVFTHRSPGKETPNEDAAAVLLPTTSTAVLVVADGLGGERAGSDASRLAVNAIVDSIANAEDPASLREVILDGIEKANSHVRDLGIGAATTLVVAEIQGNSLRTYHVGDSSILLCGKRGKNKYQSLPHSPTGYAVEAGMLDEADALKHEHHHLVSNVVGSEEMRIDIGPQLTLTRQDTLVLASDGLTDNLYVDEIIEIARLGPVKDAAQTMARACRDRMAHKDPEFPAKPDDLTFILFRLIGK